MKDIMTGCVLRGVVITCRSGGATVLRPPLGGQLKHHLLTHLGRLCYRISGLIERVDAGGEWGGGRGRQLTIVVETVL